ncbi:MAG: dynamin family protein [Candidatus Sericytochromatia bacterium]
MEFQRIYFNRKTTSNSNEIICLVENARESLSEINNLLFDFCEKYKDSELITFKKDDSTQSLGEYFEYLNKLHIQANYDLEFPKLTISALGTTKAGKSTFLNSLLGYKLAPMNDSELTAGTMKFIFDKELSNTAKMSVFENDIPIDTYEESIEKIYERSKILMEEYRSKAKTKTVEPPNILVKSNFLLGKERNFSGLDKSIDIEIVDLPGLKNINDANNLKVIQDNLKASLIVLVINFPELFDDTKREVLYNEIADIVNNVGNSSNIVFLLNKIDARTQISRPIDTIISECRNEIKQKLKLDEEPDVIPVNSLLLFYTQSVFWAYKQGNLTEYSISDDIPEPENQSVIFIKETLVSLFEDLPNKLIRLLDRNYDGIASKIQDYVDQNLLPSFEDFDKFWSACIENSGAIDINSSKGGALELFSTIQYRVRNSIKELIIGPALSPVIKEYNKFYSILENAINISKISTYEQLDKAKDDLDEINNKILLELDEIESEFKKSIENVKPKIRSNKSEDFSQALSELGFSDTNKFDFLIKRVIRDVETNTIDCVKSSFEKILRSSDFLEIIKTKWKPELCDKVKDEYDDIKTFLYNNPNVINNGEIYEFLDSDVEKKSKAEKISSSLTNLKNYVQESIIDQTKYQMQKNVVSLSDLLVEWLLNKNKDTENKLNFYIKKFDFDVSLPSVELPEVTYSFGKENILIDTYKTVSESVTYDTGKTKKVPKEVSHWFFWTKTVYVDEPIKKTEDKYTVSFPSVRNLATEWSNNLSNTHQDLWKGFCDVLIELLNMSLHQYKRVFSDILEQMEIILEIKRTELEKEKDSKDRMWEDIINFYNLSKESSENIKLMIRSK